MWLQRLHRHGDNSVNATCFSCNSLWWQCRGWCHDSIVHCVIFVLFLIRTAQNYLCPQSSVEDDAKEKGAMADHSFQASDVLHLEKRFELIWIRRFEAKSCIFFHFCALKIKLGLLGLMSLMPRKATGTPRHRINSLFFYLRLFLSGFTGFL